MTDDLVSGVQNKIDYIIGLLLYAILTGLVFWDTSLDIVASSETTRALLTSLAVAQASAVAIVASITLLNVQLVADRYSTELVRSSLRSSPFKKVLFLFIASIAFDLVLVYNIEHHSAWWYTAGVVAAAAWALTNAYALYQFVFSSVGVLTPSSLINTITKNEPAEIADRTSSIKDTDTRTAPSDINSEEEPLYQLYVIITSSVGTVDYYVVQKGLSELHTLLREAIEELDQQAGTKICQKAFLFYYPRIINKCLEKSEIDQAENAVRDLTDLLERLETEADDWHTAHFAGIQGLFKIRDLTTDAHLLNDDTIPTRIEYCPGSYWTSDRLEFILAHAGAEIDQEGSQAFYQELISKTHASVIDSDQAADVDTATDPVTLWEQEMEEILMNAVRRYRVAEPQESRQFLMLWPQLYQRDLTNRSSHRRWLVTVIFELAVFHAAHHEGEYEAGKNTLLNTLHGAQPEHTYDRIETLQGLTERQTRQRRRVATIYINDTKGRAETAYQYEKLARNMVSEAIDGYRQQNWNTDKAIEYIRSEPSVVSNRIGDYRFIDPSAGTEYSLITDPETSDGHIIKLVISDEINSELIDSLSLDGASRYFCIGPLVTGDFTASDIETIERSLPELRPPAQTSIYDYYEWSS